MPILTMLPPHAGGRAPITAALCLLTAAVLVALQPAAPGAATGNENSITSPDPSVNGIHISLVLDAAGNPVVTYLDASDRDLKVLHCNDPNCSGGGDSIHTPDHTSEVGTHSSLVLDGAGNPVVSYYAFGEGDLRLLHCATPNCPGFSASNISPDTGGDVGSHTSLALDAAGNPVVAYYDATNGNLKLLHCGDPNCSESNNVITVPAPMDADAPFTSLVLDSAGHPVIAFRSAASPVDTTPAALSLLRCDDPNCQSDESANIVNFASENGREGSLVLDDDGNPIVAYVDADGRLRLLRCDAADCANESIAILDTASVFESPSLALNANRNPTVAYYDATNGDLMLLHCNDPECTEAGTTIIAADTAGDVGLDPSLQLDAAGNPVVAYLDGPLQNLKLLHCRAPDCTQPTAPKPSPTLSLTPAATPTPVAPAGDSDCSATVDAIDAALILQYGAGLIDWLPCPDAADANVDGLVNSIDSALVLQFVAGLISALPP